MRKSTSGDFRNKTPRKAKSTAGNYPSIRNDNSLSNVSASVHPEDYLSLRRSNYPKDMVFRGMSSDGYQMGRKKNQFSRAPEDMVDEIKSLKNKLAYVSAENESLKSRCRLLDEKMAQKDKEMSAMVDPTENNKLLQTLCDSRPQTVRTFKQLHQRIFKLQTQLTDKEFQYNQLVTDMKFTKAEELRIQLDTAFTEISRLRAIVGSQSSELKKYADRKPKNKIPENERKALIQRISVMGKVIKGLDEEKQELQAKNEYLMQRMREILSTGPSPMEEIERVTPLKERTTYDRKGQTLVATMVESKPCETFEKAAPKTTVKPVSSQLMAELGATRSQASALEYKNQQLQQDVSFYRKQLHLTKKQLDNVSIGHASSVRSSESSPSPRRTPRNLSRTKPEPNSPKKALTCEDESAKMIQRAWRAHRERCLSARSKERTSDIESRELERQKDAALNILKSAVSGHLARESLDARGSKTEAVAPPDFTSASFVTSDGDANEESVSEEATEASVQSLKAAVKGHMEREKSLSSIHFSNFDEDESVEDM
ncbi:unnamed protein product [Calicophoron daubneyi]|uniref:IQ domain-containing protein E n=1 Tax=Calicophoron daubneyi TaxID=300641 RepID=A0AAV2TRQ1_CALDB